MTLIGRNEVGTEHFVKPSCIQAFLNLSTNAANLYSSSGKSTSRRSSQGSLLGKGFWFALFTEQHFLNYGWLTNTEKNLRRGSEKSNLRKVSELSISKLLPPICQSCTFDLHILGAELFPVWGKFLCQKHHDLADKFGVWHVMCSCIPISCRSWILE